MISEILSVAHRLDLWLGRKLGRPYHALLGIGLLIEIARQIRELGDVSHSGYGIVRVILTILLYSALLVHQLGELQEHEERRREGTG
jgi:hypothetical protein